MPVTRSRAPAEPTPYDVAMQRVQPYLADPAAAQFVVRDVAVELVLALENAYNPQRPSGPGR